MRLFPVVGFQIATPNLSPATTTTSHLPTPDGALSSLSIESPFSPLQDISETFPFLRMNAPRWPLPICVRYCRWGGSDRSARKEGDTRSLAVGHGRDVQREHILVETPQETSNAIARIKALDHHERMTSTCLANREGTHGTSRKLLASKRRRLGDVRQFLVLFVAQLEGGGRDIFLEMLNRRRPRNGQHYG